MAGWIKLRKKLLTDPRVVIMATKLGVDRYAVVGGLVAVWCIADEHGEHMNGLKKFDLSSMISWPNFAESMPEDWLTETDSGLRFPKYNAHNGSTAKARTATAARVARHRKRKCNAPCNAPTVTETVTREEKIREETTTTARASSLPEESAGATKPVVADKDYRASFDKFWAAHPRKTAQGRAWQYWDRMTADERTKALEYAVAYAQVFNAAPDDRRPFFKSAAKWLEERCWEDDPFDWCRAANVNPKDVK